MSSTPGTGAIPFSYRSLCPTSPSPNQPRISLSGHSMCMERVVPRNLTCFRSATGTRMSVLHSFSRQNKISLYDCVTFCLPSRWTLNVVLSFWLLWVLLLWTFMSKVLCGHVFLSLECVPGVEVPGPMVTLRLIIWGTARLFSKTDAHFPFSSAMYEGRFLHVLVNTCHYQSFFTQGHEDLVLYFLLRLYSFSTLVHVFGPFWVNFSLRGEMRVWLHDFGCGCPAVPAPFVMKTTLSP